MSQPDFDRAMERMATDAAFAASVQRDPSTALAGFSLTDDERQNLLGLRTEAPAATAAAAPVALTTRRSKSSMLGIGAVGAVAVAGAATFGYFHSQTLARYASLDGGARQTVFTAALQSTSDIATVAPPSIGRRAHQPIMIVKKVDNSSPVLFQDAATGHPVNKVVVAVQKGGADWLIEDGSDCLVTSITPSSISAGDTPTEKVAFNCAVLLVSYPNGGP